MPKIDFPSWKMPENYNPNKEVIKLTKWMEFSKIQDYVQQELYKIYNSDQSDLFKEMSKEDIFNNLFNNWYDPDELF